MDPKFYKKVLSDDPTEVDYIYWKKMLATYIVKANVPDDDQLDVLFVLCGAKAFPVVEDCDTYAAALERLDNKFQRRSTAIMNRHKLRSRKQLPSESVETFMADLQQLAKKCATTPLTAEQHRNLLISDTFVAGLQSATIRQRLLESADDDLNKLFTTALTMELAIQDAKALSFSDPSTAFPPPTLAASHNSSSTPTSTKRKCVWCGGQKHERIKCPARSSTCNKCGKKGHWATACLSNRRTTVAAVTQATSDSEDQDSDGHPQKSSILATIQGNASQVSAVVDGVPLRVLIDTGSDLSFIAESFLVDNGMCYTATTRNVSLADGSTLHVLGQFNGNIELDKEVYRTSLWVVSKLVAPLIVGMDLLRQHSQLNLKLGGSRRPATFCLALSTMNCKQFQLLPGVDCSKLKPIATQSRPCKQHAEFIQSEISRMLKNGIIQISQSPWRAQCFVATGGRKPRLVIDFSNTINIYAQLDSYPCKNIQNLLHEVSQNTFFSTVDLREAYHQVPLRPEDYRLTAFEALGKLYEFTKLPFGATNAVAIFQRTMDGFIDSYGLEKTYAYLDDIIIAGNTQDEHDRNLKAFISAASDFGIEVNKEKCKLNERKIEFLGHVIHNGTLQPDPSRFQALLDYPTPSTPKELNRIIGLFAYYAKWIQNCAELTLPLTQARSEIASSGHLPEDARNAIARLKQALVSSSLAAPLDNVPLTVETDASENALGGTLTQQGRPVAFFSRVLTPTERHQSIVEREACAIVECLRRWRHLLHSVPHFNVVTDQQSVSFLFNPHQASKIKNEKLTRWRLELSDFHFSISYRAGHLNQAADALSRCAAAKDTQSLATLHNQLCHPGVTRLAHYCKNRNLAFSISEIRSVVDSCTVCRELKPRFFKPPVGQLISSTRPWERLSMDFVGPLPSSTKNRFLLVVVDEYSRYPFAFPCSQITTDVVIGHLLQLFALFGTPSSIHSDRGTQFESEKLSQFLQRNGVVKTRTTPYRPQGNGQCERTNGTIMRTINLALRSFGLDKSKWEQVLPAALSSIRSLLCTATNCSPHDRMLAFPRASVTGCDIPNFLQQQGNTILHRVYLRAKGDATTERVTLLEAVSPYYARIQYPSGRVDTVSTRDLAPLHNSTQTTTESTADITLEPTSRDTRGSPADITLEPITDDTPACSSPHTGDRTGESDLVETDPASEINAHTHHSLAYTTPPHPTLSRSTRSGREY